jgi:hypothetical protein
VKKRRRRKVAALAAAAALAGTAAQGGTPATPETVDAGTHEKVVPDAGTPVKHPQRPGPRPLYGVPPMRGK